MAFDLRVKGYRHGKDAAEGVEDTGDLRALGFVTLLNNMLEL